MAGTTQTEICNLALLHIAKKAISIITDTNSPNAIACNRVWTIAVRETLRSNDWTFARVVEELTESATYDPTPYGYIYAYVVPVRCLSIRTIFNEGTKDKNLGEKYERVFDPATNEQLILTNCQDAYIKYTYLVSDITQFDPSFVTALGYRLAAELAKPLTGDDSLTVKMIQLFNNAVSEAQRMASYEGNIPTENRPNLFVDSRG